jgi:hypothetical protein
MVTLDGPIFQDTIQRLNSFLTQGSDFVNLVLGLTELVSTGSSSLLIVVVTVLTCEALYMSQSVKGGDVLSGEDHTYTIS